MAHRAGNGRNQPQALDIYLTCFVQWHVPGMKTTEDPAITAYVVPVSTTYGLLTEFEPRSCVTMLCRMVAFTPI